MQCPIKGDTPYFTAVQFGICRALHLQHKGQKNFPPQFWKQLYITAITEGPDLSMAAKASEAELSRYDKVQSTASQLACYQDAVKPRSFADSPDNYQFETSGMPRLSRL